MFMTVVQIIKKTDLKFFHQSEHFSGFSVGFCINEEEGYLLPTSYSSENNLPTFQLNAPVVIRVKVKRCKRTLLFITLQYC